MLNIKWTGILKFSPNFTFTFSPKRLITLTFFLSLFSFSCLSHVSISIIIVNIINKAIPIFSRLASNAFPDIGSACRIEKKNLKINHKKCIGIGGLVLQYHCRGAWKQQDVNPKLIWWKAWKVGWCYCRIMIWFCLCCYHAHFSD